MGVGHGPNCERAETTPKTTAEKEPEAKAEAQAEEKAETSEEPGATIAEMIRLELETVLLSVGACPRFAHKVGSRVEESLRSGLPDENAVIKLLNMLDVGRLPAVAAAIAPEARRLDEELGDLLEEYSSDIMKADLLVKIIEKARNVIEAVVWSRKAAGVQQLVGLVGTAFKKYKSTSAPWHELHPTVTCDGCGRHPIIGPRWKSTVLDDFDFCGACHEKHGAGHAGHPFRRVGAPGSEHGKPLEVQVAGNLTGIPEDVKNQARAQYGRCAVFNMAEDGPNRHSFHPPFRGASGAMVHAHITCDGCDQSPIVGQRFKCKDMDDFDLCSMCYAKWQSLPAFLPQVPSEARFDEIDVTGRPKTNAVTTVIREHAADETVSASAERLVCAFYGDPQRCRGRDVTEEARAILAKGEVLRASNKLFKDPVPNVKKVLFVDLLPEPPAPPQAPEEEPPATPQTAEDEEDESDEDMVKEAEKEASGSGKKQGKKRLRLLKKANKLGVKKLKLEQKRDFYIMKAKELDAELAACASEIERVEAKLADAKDEDPVEVSKPAEPQPTDHLKDSDTPEPEDVDMGAEPGLVIVEGPDGTPIVIPEEFLADALSQCALDVAATEVATENSEEVDSVPEKSEPTPEKESNVSADSWEKPEDLHDLVLSKKCARPGCNFCEHTTQGHGFCCNKCKNGEGHGPACERVEMLEAAAVSEPSEVETNDWEKAEDQFPCKEEEVAASVLASQLYAGKTPLENFWEEPGRMESEYGTLMQQYGIQEVYSLGTPKLGEEVDRKDLKALVLVANEGKEAWPAGTRLRCVAGHDLGVQSMELECNPGEVAEVTLHFDVNHGYTGQSYWAMVAPTGQPFGVLLTICLP
jgi:hypothetical protein